MKLLDRLEVGVLHGILGCDALSMIIAEHLREQVKGLLRHKMLILAGQKLRPGLACVLSNHVVVLLLQSYIVLINVGIELVCSEDLSDLHQLIVVILSLEEGLLLEDHASEHAAERPNVKRVVIGLQIDEQLGSLEVATRHTHVILLARVVEFGEAPIDQSQFAVSMVNHDVVWLHISVRDALGVTEVKGLQNLENVVSDVEVIEVLVECAEIDIACVDIFHDECGCLGHRIAYHVDQVDDVNAALESLQNLDLTPNLCLLHWLQDLDDNTLTSGSVDALIHFRILSSADLLNDLVVLLRSIALIEFDLF